MQFPASNRLIVLRKNLYGILNSPKRNCESVREIEGAQQEKHAPLCVGVCVCLDFSLDFQYDVGGLLCRKAQERPKAERFKLIV
jgi:hypothetical protein